MDLTQNKLTKQEWIGIELPVEDNEKFILLLIKEGYADLRVCRNNNNSIVSIIKIAYSPEIESYMYTEYLQEDLSKSVKQYAKTIKVLNDALAIPLAESKKKPNSKDTIRLTNTKATILAKRGIMIEFALIDICTRVLCAIHTRSSAYNVHIYTLVQLMKTSIPYINKHVLNFARVLIEWTIATFPQLIPDMIHNATELIEKNPNILKYADITLFDHQKQLFQLFSPTADRLVPKLVLYIAPTGTGKTMSPLGLSENHRVIFVCTARHVGLALARSAISMEKRVAFAFGCDSASDIRLHYYAAIDYTRDWKTGAIRKVDNGIGYKVEIMICDIKSYITAMHYMLAFNEEKDIITFWDEPTITMDLEHHDLHETIHANWSENLISKVVMSCATLPQEQEIDDTIMDFRSRFDSAEIHTISTHDCKKTISLLNKEGYCATPHTLFEHYADLQICTTHCGKIKSLLRYLDLSEIVRFIEYVNHGDFIEESYKISAFFGSIADITMDNIKIYYLKILTKIQAASWPEIYEYMKSVQSPLFPKRVVSKKSISAISSCGGGGGAISSSVIEQPPANPFAGISITTEDAHTLTDGPTIYLAENIENLGKFYISQSNIPPTIFDEIMQKIEHNNRIQKKMDEIEKKIAEKEPKKDESTDSDFKGSVKRDKSDKTNTSKEVSELSEQLNQWRMQICVANMSPQYIPNTPDHQQKWTGKMNPCAFTPDIDDENIRNIMALDVSNQIKLLLLLGIGMFVNQPNIKYMEIMKSLAATQKLFLIIAASDYIYGLNYQFSHGFIGKDLQNMTQQKTIQALGRIGRGNIQQNYTVRFRDNEIIRKLFLPVEINIEGQVMSRLMNGAAEWASENEELIARFRPEETECLDSKKLKPKYTKYKLREP